jgi:predicted nucleic acid-binding protein
VPVSARPEPDPDVQSVDRDPKADYLIALAESVTANDLVTGDNDLLELSDAPVRITPLAEFLRILEAAGLAEGLGEPE